MTTTQHYRRTLEEAEALVGKTVRYYSIMYPRRDPRDTHVVKSVMLMPAGFARPTHPVLFLCGKSGWVHADAVEVVDDTANPDTEGEQR